MWFGRIKEKPNHVKVGAFLHGKSATGRRIINPSWEPIP
ncbi:hypothetical protein B4086_5677 [Bacillus cereus]|nr:hypothetical protein B4086_5677 [Bacillus cereus]